MEIKRKGYSHFTTEWRCGAKSDRVLLPGPDGVRVKVTHLRAPVGAEWLEISYPVDETCIILSGEVVLTLSDSSQVTLTAGDVFHVPADEVYTLNVDTQSVELFCVFSQAGPEGEPVDNS